MIGPLQVNTGGRQDGDTHALAPSSSPAINAADPAACKPTDQRGVASPAGACDIGAFEYVAPTLTVTTTVTNRDGGEDRPADFSVRVTSGGADVAGSPQPGSSSGTTYTLAPGTFDVSANGPDLYTLTVGGACATDGTVTLSENQAATCTVTANDKPPVAGRSVGVIPVRGTVRFKRPGGRFRVLRESDLLPNGTTIDTLKGRVTLIAAANKQGKESKADFYDGVFKFRQSKGRRPTTTLTLTEKLSCPKAGNAIAAAKKKKRRLWGDGSGKFRTKGKHSAATVVGTKWLVEDRCTSTLTRVVRGRVSVRDFELKKTVIVQARKALHRARRVTHPTVQAPLTGQPHSKTIGRRLHARTGIRVGVAVFTAALIALAVPSLASAQQFPGVFQVDTRADGNDGECTRDCTLREAVNLSQPGQTSSISLRPGVYRLSQGPLVLREVLIIGAGLSGGQGAGARTTIIDGRGSRVFEVPAGSSSIVAGVTITGGSATTGGGAFVAAQGILNLYNTIVEGNSAGARGGGIHNQGTVARPELDRHREPRQRRRRWRHRQRPRLESSGPQLDDQRQQRHSSGRRPLQQRLEHHRGQHDRGQ